MAQVNLPKQCLTVVEKEADRRNLSLDEIIDRSMSVYTLQAIDLFIAEVKKNYKECSLGPYQRAQLHILKDYLNLIL